MKQSEQPTQTEGLGSRSSQTAIGLGYQFIAAIIVFVGSGYYLDSKTGGGHTFTLFGVAFTFIYGGYEVWKLVRLMEQENQNTTANRPKDPHEPPSPAPRA